ncbi:MAG: hypothetical protein AAFX93_10565 [Verrucomicrobiota bacterium]
MKKIITLLAFLTSCLVTYGADKHNHGDHDHGAHSYSHDGHNSEEHDPSGDAGKKAGPNGGRVIRSVKPHFEFLVTPERKVQITFLDDQYEPLAPEGQQLSLVGGSRSDPTKLSFEQNGNILISRDKLPDGNNIPVILTIKTSPEAKPIRERFQVNMSQCPTCDYREYACICGHE